MGSTRWSAAGACARHDDGSDRPAAATADAVLRNVRWLGVAFTCLQFVLYAPPAGLSLPFPRTLGLVVALPLVALNIVSHAHGRRLARRFPRGWPVAQLLVDGGVVLAVLWLFAFDAYNALWGLLILPVLQAALQLRLRGALWTWAALGTAYVLRDVWAVRTYDYLVFYPDALTYRLGVVGIVALATGSLARRLHATADQLGDQVESYRLALAEADGLRRVATASRRISSLDTDTVLRQVRDAAESIGFAPVRVDACPPAPAPPGLDGVASAVLDPAEVPGWPEGQAGRAVLAVPLRSGGEVAAVVLAGHDAPVPRRQVEALELLAAQGQSALVNARHFGERQALQDELARLALHDSLTGLPNRRLLQDRIGSALAAARRSGHGVAVLLLDLDRFKEVNDTLGHPYGDALLRQVAERLTATLRASDTAARLGGDEFAVLASAVAGPLDARQVARRVMAALQEPFTVDGVTLDVEASIGMATSPRHGTDADELLRAADVAMYTAKSASCGIAEYDPAQDEHTPARLALLGDLRRALEAGDQLALHYQPKVDLALGELVGVEALLRWHHPSRGMVPPGDFIPAAEGTGLIHRLTDRVLDLALAQVRAWQRADRQLPVAVNISTRCLLDQGLPDRVEALLRRHGVAARMLRLEITESTIMADPTRALGVLHRLHNAGIRLSIDDFGTGYSSMSYLKRLPVDELKIDRSFVQDMNRHASDATLVRTVVELGHNLGLHVVAEGVEDAATLGALGDLGCDVAQGFYVARPMPAEALASWLADYRAGGAPSYLDAPRAP